MSELPPPVTLDSFGDVLDDRDLGALVKMGPRWAEVVRRRAKAANLAPDLPATIPGIRQPRYLRESVAVWLRTGRSARGLRRVG